MLRAHSSLHLLRISPHLPGSGLARRDLSVSLSDDVYLAHLSMSDTPWAGSAVIELQGDNQIFFLLMTQHLEVLPKFRSTCTILSLLWRVMDQLGIQVKQKFKL